MENAARRGGAIFLTVFSALFLTAISPCAARAQSTAVLTGQYNIDRTGANLAETTLTPSNVSPATFGLLFSQPVDADILAQPLYVPGLTINGAVHNVAFVATLNNSVYAFDADTSQPALWQASLGTPVPIGTTSQPTTGILSTPVIDLNLKVIFVVTFTYESKTAVYRLHALNLVTGVAITNIVVRGAVAGTGDDSQATACTSGNGGTVPPPCIPFKAHEQFQRPALLEGALSSTIYLGFGNLNGQEITTPDGAGVYRRESRLESMRPWGGNLDVRPWAGIGSDGNLLGDGQRRIRGRRYRQLGRIDIAAEWQRGRRRFLHVGQLRRAEP
jgi:hypothetical protein